MTSLFTKIQDAMAAAAFAEAGEFDTARTMLKNAHKKVLLGIEGEDVQPKALRYALALCGRIGAGLDVVHVRKGSGGQAGSLADGGAVPRRTGEKNRKLGVRYIELRTQEPFEESIAQYATKRRDVLFLVLGSGKYRPGATGSVGLPPVLRGLKCPVVVPTG